jgi:hypothetical protein
MPPENARKAPAQPQGPLLLQGCRSVCSLCIHAGRACRRALAAAVRCALLLLGCSLHRRCSGSHAAAAQRRAARSGNSEDGDDSEGDNDERDVVAAAPPWCAEHARAVRAAELDWATFARSPGLFWLSRVLRQSAGHHRFSWAYVAAYNGRAQALGLPWFGAQNHALVDFSFLLGLPLPPEEEPHQ